MICTPAWLIIVSRVASSTNRGTTCGVVKWLQYLLLAINQCVKSHWAGAIFCGFKFRVEWFREFRSCVVRSVSLLWRFKHITQEAQEWEKSLRCPMHSTIYPFTSSMIFITSLPIIIRHCTSTLCRLGSSHLGGEQSYEWVGWWIQKMILHVLCMHGF